MPTVSQTKSQIHSVSQSVIEPIRQSNIQVSQPTKQPTIKSVCQNRAECKIAAQICSLPLIIMIEHQSVLRKPNFYVICVRMSASIEFKLLFSSTAAAAAVATLNHTKYY